MMFFDPIIRTRTIESLLPSCMYHWKGDEWEGLTFFDDTELAYDEFLTEYNKLSITVIQERQLDYFDYELQKVLDNKAQEFGYDNIHTAVTYADEVAVLKFKQEGSSFRAWRSKFYNKAYEIMEDVKAGERETPTLEELLLELPSFELLPL